ncbi:cytochrome P450 2C31-like [Homarus americanus]|uniref:Cytochrome P450 2D15-like n=1 Tax=Homarus americanus TaxID=6706 RepID=A0A8J5MRQ9_HOMAM|nr:cytochrome P450 2C31-like [Homarus americanus]KAG7161543.1 Cytochrome P450 2D15-like [Homarus americanus]
MLEWIHETLGCGGVVLLVLSLLLLLFYHGPGVRPHNFPPGLPMLPVVSSLLTMRGGPTRKILQDLKKKYGNLASFGMFNTRVVLVSGVSVMKEIFTNKVTTGRPSLAIFKARNLMLSDGRSTNLGILALNGSMWQEQRRFLLRHLRDLGFGKTSLEPIIQDEVTELMKYIEQQKDQPISMKRLFNRSVVNSLWGLVMGKRYPYGHEKLNALLNTFLQLSDINALDPMHFIPGIHIVMLHTPFMKKLMDSLRDIADFIKEEIREFMDAEDPTSKNCLMSDFLLEMDKKKGEPSTFHMDQLTAVVAEMFVAGMETTSSTLQTGIYFLAKNPEVQQRLQEELDQVVEKERLPSFADLEKLPYTQATIHEIQRFFNLVLFALPHSVTEDCTLGGYNIPKGTILLANVDDAMADCELWKNPKEFNPENFLDANGNFVKNEAFMPFGTGKRQCAGEPLARQELFLFLTSLLHRFSFSIVEEFQSSSNNPIFNAVPSYTATAKLRTAV